MIFLLGGADDIDVNSIKIMQENLTHGVLNLKWDEPKDYNGLIVNYYIELKSSDVSITMEFESNFINNSQCIIMITASKSLSIWE